MCLRKNGTDRHNFCKKDGTLVRYSHFMKVADPGSILAQAMRRYVLGKDTLPYFPLRPTSLTVVVAKTDETLANRTQKRCCALVWLD